MARVESALSMVPLTGRVGSKVFISALGAALGLSSSDMQAFKSALIEAMQAGLVSLSRADMAPLYDQAMVRESETILQVGSLRVEFHLVSAR